MPKLPQINVRLGEEHHGLIRRLAQRLREDPAFAESLALMLDDDSPRLDEISLGLSRIVALEDRTAALEEREPRMVRIEALEARMAALEKLVTGPQAAPLNSGNSEVKPRAPRPAAAGKRRSPTPITDDLRRQVHDLRASGMSRDAVAKELEIGGSTVSRILEAPRPAG